MEHKKEQTPQSQQGTGSAENKGENRENQLTPNTSLTQPEKEDIAAQIGEDKNAIAGMKDLGAVSGRDDASGGSGDRMEGQSTGQETDR